MALVGGVHSVGLLRERRYKLWSRRLERWLIRRWR